MPTRQACAAADACTRVVLVELAHDGLREAQALELWYRCVGLEEELAGFHVTSFLYV